jgi:succinate dehydrogenase / fumarate reductase cytochrome b subunit
MTRLDVFCRSTVGQKAVVAVTGAILFAWVLLHLLGNLTLFSGPGAADGYAAALRRTGPLLWLLRAGLAVAFVVHVTLTASLARRARRARHGGYVVRRHRAATLSSRTMRVGGVLLLGFVVFHLLHLTFGALQPSFAPGHVYGNVVRGLRPKWIAGVYVGAAAIVGLHVFHGLWSAVRSVGLGERSSGAPHRKFVTLVAIVLFAGFASVPLAVALGVVR